MAVITQSGSTRTVVVSKPVPVRTVEQQLEAVEVPAANAGQAVAEKQTQTAIEVGRQGPPGPPGPPGPAGDSPVQSVNGMVGDVELDAEAVGADPEGAALAAAAASMAAHLADPTPHPDAILDGGNW